MPSKPSSLTSSDRLFHPGRQLRHCLIRRVSLTSTHRLPHLEHDRHLGCLAGVAAELGTKLSTGTAGRDPGLSAEGLTRPSIAVETAGYHPIQPEIATYP